MLKKEHLEKIKKEIENFFEKAGFEVKIKVAIQDETLKVDLESKEPQVLIGQKGRVLSQIQRILKLILNRKVGELFFVDLDVNDYKKKRTQYLKEMARKAADEVALTKKEKILPPMPASERRIIHLELADRKNITTQSIGKEPKRKVVIKPYP